MDRVVSITNFDKHTFDGNAYFSETTIIVPGGGTVYTYGKTSREINVFMEDRAITVLNANSTIDVEIELYEDPTLVLDNAVAIPILNNNRNMVAKTSFENYKGILVGDISDMGLQLPRSNRILADKRQSPSASSKAPYIMKRGTGYLLKITNNSVTASTITLFWDWWEDGDQ